MSTMSPSLNVTKLQHHLGTRNLTLPTQIVKRDGSQVPFDIKRIARAIGACLDALPEPASWSKAQLTEAVANAVAARFTTTVPTVEEIQDLVEVTLLAHGEIEAARAYISYRNRHAEMREARVPAEVRAQFERDKEYFPTPMQQFQFYDKYSRFNWDLERRETWEETVDRNVAYLRWLVDNFAKGRVEDPVFDLIRHFMLKQMSMPSMRSLAMAGEAAQRNGLSIYNCSYLPVRDLEAFSEMMLISMAGCGVGYSVERQYVEQLPRVQRQTGETTEYWVEDTTEGWAESMLFGLQEWFAGRDVTFRYDMVRKAGTILRVKGGRASGPAPLKFVHDFARRRILARQGSTLSTLDAHDIACATGGAAVSGGMRRTAMIALFDWDDLAMRTCKDGDLSGDLEVRQNANNSAVWPDEITQADVAEQLLTMFRANRGEPGIFSRSNANRTRPERRQAADFGTNPCGEINLRPYGLCNLSIAVARPDDTELTLTQKVDVAALIGTIQSLAINFPGMRQEWIDNCIDERLLGVDIMGQMDVPMLDDEGLQARLKERAIKSNEFWADQLGIKPAAAVTCGKPGGNSSVLLDASSGQSARWAPYILRRTIVNTTTPLFRVLKDAGVPMEPKIGQTALNATAWVVAWPVKAPEGAITRNDRTALEQCEYWKMTKLHFTEHNPSVTITYQPDELLDIIGWVWENREVIGGMTFFPASDAAFEQAPLEEISLEEYEQAMAEFPDIDYSLLYAYESEDMTTAAQEVACFAGESCEI